MGEGLACAGPAAACYVKSSAIPRLTGPQLSSTRLAYTANISFSQVEIAVSGQFGIARRHPIVGLTPAVVLAGMVVSPDIRPAKALASGLR